MQDEDGYDFHLNSGIFIFLLKDEIYFFFKAFIGTSEYLFCHTLVVHSEVISHIILHAGGSPAVPLKI